MLQISATIITLNEERRLARALESLSVADEIVVVDCGSTDRTAEIAEAHGARLLSHPWEGYARQKNFAAAQAKYPWVLSIDADEALSPELASEVKRVKKEGPGEAAGFPTKGSGPKRSGIIWSSVTRSGVRVERAPPPPLSMRRRASSGLIGKPAWGGSVCA